jgi:hypothetical protein
MNRTIYFLAIGYLAFCGVWILKHRTPPSVRPDHPVVPVHYSSGQEWFTANKQYCNAVEAELAQRNRPAPATPEGQGYSAACYALGGKIEQARATIDRLPSNERAAAANIVFNVAHPVADAGDDRSAGPIMELVVGYIPNHYMALYHAGMSEYALAQPDLAREHLESFLTYYRENDGWTQNARDVLARLR